jgi:hypothetical protein
MQPEADFHYNWTMHKPPRKTMPWLALTLALVPQAASVRAQNGDEAFQAKGGDPDAIFRDAFKDVLGILHKIVVLPGQKVPESPAGPGVPSDFGASGGTEISNKATVLNQIDRAVGTGKPPAFELIYCDVGPDTNLGMTISPSGHLTARYTMPDGTQKLFNVFGTSLVSPMKINFSNPEDYFFGTGNFSETNGGIYNRTFYTVRIETLAPDQLTKLDAYYTGLVARGKAGTAMFDLITPQIKNAMSGGKIEYGNCATWTSTGLHEASGLLPNISMYPKEDWTRLYEEMKANDPSNVHVVAYHSIGDSAHLDGMKDHRNGPAALWDPVASARYWNLDKFADVTVDVPPGSTEAIVKRVQPR